MLDFGNREMAEELLNYFLHMKGFQTIAQKTFDSEST